MRTSPAKPAMGLHAMVIAGQRTGDRNLLFGILAMQLDFVCQATLVTAMQNWLLDHSRSLGEVLEEHGQLSPHRRRLLEALVDEHLAQHKDNVQESLAALPSLEMAEKLLELADTNLAPEPAATVMLEADPHQTVPTPAEDRHSRYRVLRPLGRGGLGLVWAALDRELHREVALKEIQPRLAEDTESRVRFLREAEITGGLEHPGIVPIYGLGAYPDGRPFYAMRLIRGESLREAITRFHGGSSAECETLEFRKLLKPFIDACNAVAYAHSRNVLHRDIKPDNIMLGRFGETLVVDWGLAKAWDPDRRPASEATNPSPDETLVWSKQNDDGPLRLSAASSSDATQMGSMLGTPQYMSPEQAEGRLDLVSPASDVYSLGATLYGVLTGQAPCAGSDVRETLERVRRGEFPRPRQVRRDVPPALEAICLKAMSLAPRDRYATASELAEDLDCWLADEPVRAYVEPWRQRLSRWSRKHRAWTQAGALALVAMAVTATLAAVFVCHAWQNEAWALKEVSRHLEQEQREHDLAVQARREADAARHATDEAQSELARQITLLGLEDRLRHCSKSKPLFWEIAADRIAPLYERMRVPTANDLSMQTWPAYRAARPERLAGCTTIYLLPIGSLSAEQQELARQTGEFLSRFFALPVRWLDPAPVGSLSEPEAIERLISNSRPRDAVAVLGITNVDLGRDFDASRGSVVSFARLDNIPSGDAARAGVLRRMLKTSLTAVGQAVGIRDFAAYHCGMNSAGSLSALDEKPLAFCPECEQKVWWLCDIEPVDRYQRLVEFAAEQRLEPELRHWQQMLDAVRTPRKQ